MVISGRELERLRFGGGNFDSVFTSGTRGRFCPCNNGDFCCSSFVSVLLPFCVSALMETNVTVPSGMIHGTLSGTAPWRFCKLWSTAEGSVTTTGFPLGGVGGIRCCIAAWYVVNMAAYGDMDTEGLHRRGAGLGRVGFVGK